PLAVEAGHRADAGADHEHLDLAPARGERGHALALVERRLGRERHELLAVELEERAGAPDEHALLGAPDAVPPRPPVRRPVEREAERLAAGEADGGPRD